MGNDVLKLTTDLLPGFIILMCIMNHSFNSRTCVFLSSLEILMALVQKVHFYWNLFSPLTMCISVCLLCYSLVSWLSGFLQVLSEVEDENEAEDVKDQRERRSKMRSLFYPQLSVPLGGAKLLKCVACVCNNALSVSRPQWCHRKI